jgi:DDE family transposase
MIWVVGASYDGDYDPDAKITKMKDGRTHLAHKAEHAVDMETGAIVAVTLQPADRGDTTSIEKTLEEARGVLSDIAEDAEAAEELSEEMLSEVVADKGYHSNAVLAEQASLGVRTYISEPKRGSRNWRGKGAEKKAVYANRRRIRGSRGKGLMRQRGELIERSFAHCYETGGMRRTHLRNHPNILKRELPREPAGQRYNLRAVARPGDFSAGSCRAGGRDMAQRSRPRSRCHVRRRPAGRPRNLPGSSPLPELLRTKAARRERPTSVGRDDQHCVACSPSLQGRSPQPARKGNRLGGTAISRSGSFRDGNLKPVGVHVGLLYGVLPEAAFLTADFSDTTQPSTPCANLPPLPGLGDSGGPPTRG